MDLETAVFLYHDVAVNPEDSGLVRRAAIPYKHSPAEFDKNLDQIALSSVYPSLVTGIDSANSGRYLLLTFDDGGKSSLQISEMLVNRGWRGHFFIITNRIGDNTFLTREEIRRIHKMGHIIGSHSHTHPDIFYRQSLTEMMDEWNKSSDILSQIIGEPCIAASVPGGDVSQQVYTSATEAGLNYLFTSDPTLKPRKFGNCWVFGRVCIKATTPVNNVNALAQFRNWQAESLKWRGKKAAKKIFFPLYKLYVKQKTDEQNN